VAVGSIGNLKVVLDADVKGFMGGMAAADARMAQSSSRMQATGNKLAGVLKMGLAAGVAGVGVALASSVKVAGDFEQKLSALKAVAGPTATQFAALREAALQLGASSVFSARQVADAETELAKAGVSTAGILGGALKGSLSLAAAGGLDLADAAKIAANAMNLFRLKGSEVTHIADAFATAANTTTADVADFGMALTQGGAAAKAAGLSFDQTVVILEAMAKAGVKNSDAGTSMKNALIQILSPSNAAAKAMRAHNLTLTDAKGNFVNAAEASTRLRAATEGMTAAQKVAFLSTIAGTDGFRTLLALIDAGPATLAGYTAGLTKTGAAATTAAVMQDNFKGKLEQFKGALEVLQIRIGTALLPVLAKMATALADAAAWVGAHWPQIKAVFETVMDAVRRAVEVAVTWIKANVVPAIQGVIAGLQTAWGRLGPIVLAAFNAVKAVVGPAIQTIKAVIETVMALLSGDWGKVWNGLKGIASNALQAVVAAIKGLIGTFFAAARALGTAIWDGIKAGLAALAGLASKLVQFVGSAISSAAAWALQKAAGIGQALATGIWNAIQGLGGWLKGKVESWIGGLISSLNPFSPMEHGGAKYIGEPLIRGAANAILAGMTVLSAALQSTLLGAVKAVPGVSRNALLEKLGLTIPTQAWEADPLSKGNLAMAMAQLTPQLSDDLAALQTLVGEATATLGAAAKSGSAQAYLTAASGLKQARDNLAALGPMQLLPDGTVVPLGPMSDTTASTAAAAWAPANVADSWDYSATAAAATGASAASTKAYADWFAAGSVGAMPMATGGIVSKPTLALIGEAGPEMVVPLGAGGGYGGGGGGAATYNTSVTVNGANMTPEQIIRLVDTYERRNGQRWVRVRP
jgi:TP901 family phage tail tape measure protein